MQECEAKRADNAMSQGQDTKFNNDPRQKEKKKKRKKENILDKNFAALSPGVVIETHE